MNNTNSQESLSLTNHDIWRSSLTGRGLAAWILALLLTGFYVALYWFPEYLGMGLNGKANSGLIKFFDPLSAILGGKPASQWFVYGTLYTLAILVFGIKFILKYWHNRYQKIRTVVVMLSQLFFAYLIPEIMEGLNSDKPYFNKDLKNMWPLNYYFFDSWHLDNMQKSGSLGMFYLVAGIFMFAVFTPIITYFVGKRWYCSWICGCGGLAETAGDSFRHLSSKKVSAWKFERYMVHSVLVFVVLMTAGVLYGYFTGADSIFGINIYNGLRQPYGFLIGSLFSGVIGVGFYPLMGSRVWCRFGCPLAAYMGILQRFKSKFRITTNGGQCISCGNCSTYCEMGIDVRAYAQKGQNIVRASCVGCGICAEVCPRGVLKLENGPEAMRIEEAPILLGNNMARLNTK
jgi:ferredoxin-type protein NapH